MIKKIVIVLLLIASLNAQTAIPPSAGDGTESNPYQITTLENLYWITADPINRDDHYIQIADINAAETAAWFPTDTGGFYGWEPILHFAGSYDGQGYIIDSLYIFRDTTFVGFFKDVYGDESIISNLGLTNVRITGGDYVGGLTGVALTQTVVNYCYCTGSITGNNYVGGLTGNNVLSEINYCYTDVTIKANGRAGGLSGWNSLSSSISNCYSSGSVSSEGGRCGGLVGWASDSTVSFCYSTCSVNGAEDIGGLIGYKSYLATTRNSFWDMETSGLDSSAGGTGRTTAEMKTQSTYTDSGWNFIDTWVISPGYNSGYPILRWQVPGVGLEEQNLIPHEVSLSQNYPNPFNPTTIISYAIPEDSNVKLSIYDISGHLVEALVDKYHQAGQYNVKWNASKYSSGIYISRLESSYGTHSRKMVLIK